MQAHTEEEYDVLALPDVKRVMQARSTRWGRPLDGLTVEGSDGGRFTRYFDVSLPMSRSPFRPK
jgi:hypothetical protein